MTFWIFVSAGFASKQVVSEFAKHALSADIVIESDSVCFLWNDGTIELAAVITNNTSQPLIIDRGPNLTLSWLDVNTIWSFGPVRTYYVPPATAAAFVAIPSKKTDVVQFRGKFAPEQPERSVDHAFDCDVELPYKRARLDDIRHARGHARARNMTAVEVIPEPKNGRFGIPHEELDSLKD